MRTAILLTLLLFVASAYASDFEAKHHISVSFSIDGKQLPCDAFGVVLRLNGQSFHPKTSGTSFEVPSAFQKPTDQWNDSEKVDISLSCSGQEITFLAIHPGFVSEGSWHLGIAHPVYATEEYCYTRAFERGSLLAYLEFEGEPGVQVFLPQPNPPIGMREALLQEQADASGGRARDIAYTLAVFNVDYARNRDYLVSALKDCVSRSKDSTEDDTCNDALPKFLSNLYWRGDDSLLSVLFDVAERRRDTVDGIGRFFSDLLDSRGSVAVSALNGLPNDRQSLICTLAYEDDLSWHAPKRERIKSFLRGQGSAAATRCAEALEEAHSLLTLEITPERDSYTLTDPVSVRVELTNVSHRTLCFPPPSQDCYFGPTGSLITKGELLSNEAEACSFVKWMAGVLRGLNWMTLFGTSGSGSSQARAMSRPPRRNI